MVKLIVFSICKDEAKTIGQVLDDIPSKIDGVDKIQKLVVSDGSTDTTVAIAKQHGAEVIEGFAQKRLAFRFEQALDWVLTNGADIAVNIDGDLQFSPKDIPKLVRPIIMQRADFVAADRFTDAKIGKKVRPANMPRSKYYANILGSRVVGILSGEKFRDVTCGFRAYNRKAMIALNINNRYTYTQESFQMLALKRLSIATTPIKVKYFPGRESRVVTSFLQFLVNSTLGIIRSFRDFQPLKFFFYLGLPFFVVGLVSSSFVSIHWLNNHVISPYKGLGVFGIYALSLGIFIWVLGLLADMLSRNLNNQEKILEHLKELRYKRENDIGQV